jgi:hypothetical protein
MTKSFYGSMINQYSKLVTCPKMDNSCESAEEQDAHLVITRLIVGSARFQTIKKLFNGGYDQG